MAVLLIASAVYQQCDADSSGFVDKEGLLPSKLVEQERMRHKQHFTPMEPETAEGWQGNRQEDLQPAKQTALFRASVKKMISDRLTRLFDSSTNTEHARRMAKDRISHRVKECRTGLAAPRHTYKKIMMPLLTISLFARTTRGRLQASVGAADAAAHDFTFCPYNKIFVMIDPQKKERAKSRCATFSFDKCDIVSIISDYHMMQPSGLHA
jgi:hypothetical protein